MINEYKEKWARGEIKSDYDDCRYAPDKSAYAREWIKKAHANIDPDTPKNIVDRICHLKLEDIEHPDIPYINLKTRWSDKVGVYEELANMNLREICLPYEFKTYSETLDENNLFELDMKPKDWTYIIKCNHGSGWNLLYRPCQSNHKVVMDKINGWLATNYAYISGLEMQYKWIKPGYIIQPVMVYKPLDWSFWCENGEIEGVGLTRKNGKNFEDYIAFVDKYGNQNDWFIGGDPEQTNINSKQKEILKQMIPYVERIAKQFKFVRCDMYYMNGKVYFGEATFTPCSGILDITYTKKEKQNV
jgi:hypothetical protein